MHQRSDRRGYFISRGLAVTLCLWAACLLATPAVQAQDITPDDQLLADELVHLALSRLATPDTPQAGPDRSPEAVRIQQTALLLDAALNLNPTDADAWQLRAEAADRLDDAEARLTALRQLARLRPESDRVKLELILELISRKQTLDDRLSAVDSLWRSPAGQALSEPTRSRLASYAAELAGELVQPDDMRLWMQRAVRLDSTNARAAAMALQLAHTGTDSSLNPGPAAARLTAATPLSPDARLTLADLLLRESAYARAVSQFSAAQQLSAGPLPDAAYRDWLLSLAAVGQDEALEQGLEQIAIGRARANAGPDAPQELDEAQANAARAALPLDFQLIGLAALDAAPERQAAQDRITQIFNTLKDDQKAPLAWVAAFYRDKPESALDLLPAPDAEDRATRLTRAMIAAVNGDEPTVRTLAEPLAEEDPVAALALALVSGMDTAGKARELQSVVQRWPGSLAGLVAARRIMKQGRTVEATAAGEDILLTMQRFPTQTWDLDLRQNPWLDITARLVNRRINPFEPAEVEIRLTNTSQLPLTVGRGQTVTGSVLITLLPRYGGKPFSDPGAIDRDEPQQSLPPVFVQLDTTITLAPKSTLTKIVRIDRSPIATLTRDHPDKTLAVPFTLVLEPQLIGDGRMVPGLLGRTEVVQGLVMMGTSQDPDAVAAWGKDLQGTDAKARMQAAAHLAMRLRTGNRQAANLLLEAWTTANPTLQAFIAAYLPLNAAVAAPLRQRIAESDEPLVQVVWLTRSVTDAQDPVLEQALRSRDDTVRSLARSLRDSLEAPAAP